MCVDTVVCCVMLVLSVFCGSCVFYGVYVLCVLMFLFLTCVGYDVCIECCVCGVRCMFFVFVLLFVWYFVCFYICLLIIINVFIHSLRARGCVLATKNVSVLI